MEALIRPLERVVEATEWFVRTPALRLLHIATSGVLRVPVLRHVAATELLEINSCPFFVLEAPTEPADDGWSLRCEELRADWQGLLEGAPDPRAVGPLWPEQSGAPAVVRFALELGKALAALRPPLPGLIVVLAPVWVRDPARWRGDLRALLGARELAKARFIVVETDDAAARDLVDKLGPAAEHVDARVSDSAVRADMAARIDAMKNAPAGASPFQLSGGAGPPVVPPVRKGQAAAPSGEQRAAAAAELGLSPTLLDPDAMKELRVLVLSAAAAMQEGRPADAIPLQRQARDFCVRHGMAREAVVNELCLAGYVLQAGRPERALEIFRDGRVRAEAAGLIDMAVQAQIAVGSCLLVSKRVDDAAAAYAEAGQLGAGANAAVLAIEAFRMCGQLLATKGRLQEATIAFRRALETGQQGGPEVQTGSSFATAARQLAALCRKHGLKQQADALDAQAAVVENGALEPPSVPPEAHAPSGPS